MTWKGLLQKVQSVGNATLPQVRAAWTWTKTKLEEWKDRTAALQSIATIIALALAGWWTYKNFFEFRQDRPRISITYSVNQFPILNQRVLLAVSEKFTNMGTVAVKPGIGFIRVNQVLPLPDSVEHKWNSTATDQYPDDPDHPEKKSCVKLPEKGTLGDTATDVCVWPVIAFQMHDWAKADNPLLLEPGEQDSVQNFFVVPDSIQVICIYSGVRHPTQLDLAWHGMTIYDLRGTPPTNGGSTIHDLQLASPPVNVPNGPKN